MGFSILFEKRHIHERKGSRATLRLNLGHLGWPRALQERPSGAQERPKAAQDRPKSGQEDAKSGQERPKSAPRADKRGPRAPQERPRSAKSGSEEARCGPRAAKSSPRAAKSSKKVAQRRPRAIPNGQGLRKVLHQRPPTGTTKPNSDKEGSHRLQELQLRVCNYTMGLGRRGPCQ